VLQGWCMIPSLVCGARVAWRTLMKWLRLLHWSVNACMSSSIFPECTHLTFHLPVPRSVLTP
jgi:hypothetical protein